MRYWYESGVVMVVLLMAGQEERLGRVGEKVGEGIGLIHVGAGYGAVPLGMDVVFSNGALGGRRVTVSATVLVPCVTVLVTVFS